MAKAEVKIDTTEAKERMEELKKLSQEATVAFKLLGKAASNAKIAMDNCRVAMEDLEKKRLLGLE